LSFLSLNHDQGNVFATVAGPIVTISAFLQEVARAKELLASVLMS